MLHPYLKKTSFQPMIGMCWHVLETSCDLSTILPLCYKAMLQKLVMDQCGRHYLPSTTCSMDLNSRVPSTDLSCRTHLRPPRQNKPKSLPRKVKELRRSLVMIVLQLILCRFQLASIIAGQNSGNTTH